jgi:ribosomal protein S18 acetylase RimI-like enzyme
MRFQLRPAVDDDRAFLFALKQATMRQYVIATWGAWSDGDQYDHFAPDLAHTALVWVDGRAVAMVEARIEPEGLYLANVQVTPDMQSRGLGGAIVELLAASAHARGRALVLRVLKVNHRARQFYERSGLRVAGELEHHWSMALPPPITGGGDDNP